jgi:hypothetical protein
VQAKAQRIRRHKKKENQYIQNKVFKEDTKQFYQYPGVTTIEIKDHLHMEEDDLYWKSVREENVQHNKKAELIKKKVSEVLAGSLP